MSLAPPYIPRSIRQVDQSNPDSDPLNALPSAAPGESSSPPGGFRITDVNSWLHSIQNQAVSNVSFAQIRAEGNTATGAAESHDRANVVDDNSGPPRRRYDNSVGLDSPSASRVIEFSSPPLPLNVLNVDNESIDGPIVLGGDRVSVNGSRPNSARPRSPQRMQSVCRTRPFSFLLT